MIRVPSLVFAAVLMTSATAFADTPDPNATGEAALPSGSNGGPPAENSTDATAGKNNADALATAPGEENKGKPKVVPQ